MKKVSGLNDPDDFNWTEKAFADSQSFRDVFPVMADKLRIAQKMGRPSKPPEERLGTFTVRLPLADIARLRAIGAEKTREVLHKLAESV